MYTEEKMRIPGLWRLAKIMGKVLLVVLGVLLLSTGLFALKVLSREPVTPVPSTTDASLDRKSCLECDAPIADEWRESYHYRSIAGPYWKDVREMGYAKVFDRIRKPCASCHAPANVLDLPSTMSSKASGDEVLGVECTPNLLEDPKGIIPRLRADDVDLGVDCVSCHVSQHGIVGSGRRSTEAHKIVADPRFQNASVTSGSFCVTCHLSAVKSWQQTRYATEGTTCLDCHMPYVKAPSVVGGPERVRRSHRFLADKDLVMLKSAMSGTLQITPDRKVRMLVANTGVGHFLPSGGNWLLVYLKMYDSSNRLVDVRRETLGRDETLLLDFWPFNADSRIPAGKQKEIVVPLAAQHGRVEAMVRYWDWMHVVKTIWRQTQAY